MKERTAIMDAMKLSWLLLTILFLLGSGCKSPSGPTQTFVEETYVHERPAWSPNSLKIAFTVRIPDSAGVYLVDSTGANLRLVKSGAGVGLTWSADSKWLAFSMLGNLYKIMATGDSLTQLTNGGSDFRPAWSFNGKWIAYVNAGIRLLNVATSEIINLVPYGDYPAWHPNSTEVLYVLFSQAGNTRYFTEFRTFSFADTSETTWFSFFADAIGEFGSMSPDTTYILMSLRPPDNSGISQVFRADLIFQAMDQLTFDGGDYPAWSPNGRKIVYMRSTKGDGGLWIMNADGSGKHRITTP